MFIFIHAIFLLFVAHVLSDYLFTSNFIYRQIVNVNTPKKDLVSIMRRAEEAHALIAGFAVYLVCLRFNIPHPFIIGLSETVLHIFIDHKLHDSKKNYSFESDQVLHYVCKLLFALYICIVSTPV